MQRPRSAASFIGAAGVERADAALAAGLATLAILEVSLGDKVQGAPGARLSAALAVTLPLAWRRVLPLASSAIVLAALAIVASLAIRNEPPTFSLLAFLVAAYSPAAHEELRRALVSAGMAIGAMSVFLFVGGHGHDAATVSEAAFGYGEVAVAWALGRAVYGRQARGDRFERLARTLEHDREEQGRRAVAGERTRIARELHDVVAHSVSLMVVQAQAGRRVLDRDRDRAAQSFGEIEAAGRQALTELERMLGVMRADGDGESSFSPQPRLVEMPELIERARGAGVPVQLRIEGEATPLARGLDLTAYRVIQEALTNVIKHACGGSAEVAISYRADALELRVANTAGEATSPPARTNGTGHGLIGMRERVALYDGTLQAGPQPDGGYLVSARLPLSPAT